LYTCDYNEIQYQLSNLKKNLHIRYKNIWNQERQLYMQNSKLELYTKCKEEFGFSEYLTVVKNPKHRIALAKMRLSAHRLPIETGRYDNTPRVDRLCPLGCNLIGDEAHYLLQCSHPFMATVRAHPIQSIANMHPQFHQLLTEQEKCAFLLSHDNHQLLRILGQLCQKVNDTFREVVY
jgi:hypothetical protein